MQQPRGPGGQQTPPPFAVAEPLDASPTATGELGSPDPQARAQKPHVRKARERMMASFIRVQAFRLRELIKRHARSRQPFREKNCGAIRSVLRRSCGTLDHTVPTQGMAVSRRPRGEEPTPRAS